MQKLAIIGGTGRVGKLVIQTAIEQGYALNVLARDPSKVPHHPHITIITGSATDKEALEELVHGTIAVVSTLGPSGMNQSLKAAKISAKEHTSSKSTELLLPIMKENGIDRFILCGGASLQHPDDNNNWFMNFMLTRVAHKILGEMTVDRQNELSLLQKSDIRYTIARAAKMDDDPAKAPLKTSNSRFQGETISTQSLAEFLVSQVKESNYINKAVYVAT